MHQVDVSDYFYFYSSLHLKCFRGGHFSFFIYRERGFNGISLVDASAFICDIILFMGKHWFRILIYFLACGTRVFSAICVVCARSLALWMCRSLPLLTVFWLAWSLNPPPYCVHLSRLTLFACMSSLALISILFSSFIYVYSSLVRVALYPHRFIFLASSNLIRDYYFYLSFLADSIFLYVLWFVSADFPFFKCSCFRVPLFPSLICF